MNTKKENPYAYKWIAIFTLALIPISGGIAFILELNRDAFQFLLMLIGLSAVSWRSWDKYKQLVRQR
ncbi:hypothetical protein FZC79_15270 [Rossellomorea vietnamensis]|uniref:Uncharacterized protein n=1 Tax=Rossellomorea vietnamensis TaxID=218284 RepID=A0A5D4KB38_9BACI|nr:hypothetical protein [Rossellomorea vietnamensis]TYR74176.1 hypothetical protein FZC79_15270 [Rossellomorea vietnamensis]